MTIVVQGDLFANDYDGVFPISREETKPLILGVHYAKRMPSIRFAYGLFRHGELAGICTYGIPPSHTMLKGVCGPEYAKDVLELNRLCLAENLKNDASRLVAGSLKQLGNKIVVTYADTTQGHYGYVYQACNAIYTGETKPIKEIYLKSRPELHHTTHRGKTYAQMEAEHGDDVAYRKRSIKHRYVFIVGDRRYKKKMRKLLRWKQFDYPKER